VNVVRAPAQKKEREYAPFIHATVAVDIERRKKEKEREREGKRGRNSI
jgi:hypothetical protein